jgi:hypothetical protein
MSIHTRRSLWVQSHGTEQEQRMAQRLGKYETKTTVAALELIFTRVTSR